MVQRLDSVRWYGSNRVCYSVFACVGERKLANECGVAASFKKKNVAAVYKVWAHVFQCNSLFGTIFRNPIVPLFSGFFDRHFVLRHSKAFVDGKYAIFRKSCTFF